MVEQLRVLINKSSTLLQIHEFFVLPEHDAHRNMLATEGLVELRPLHMVSGTSGSEVGPPCLGGSKQLLGSKRRHLVLGAAEEPELGHIGVKPIVGIQRFTRFSKDQRVSSQELCIGALGLTSSIAGSVASTGGVGHEQA
jgi:hypothetical protein